MSTFASILVPLDGSAIAQRSLGCAVWLGSRLGARVHVLTASAEPATQAAPVAAPIPETYRSAVEIHEIVGEATAAVLSAVDRYDIDLIIMTAQGESAQIGIAEPIKLVGHVAYTVLERSSAPVILLPPSYVESLPWRTVLAPISGEPETDEALTLALKLAHALDLDASVAHVTDTGTGGGPSSGGLAQFDAPHHEYAEMLNEFVARACPLCNAQERGHLKDFRLFNGEVGRELRDFIAGKPVDLLVVGWHGRFMAGHAQILKQLLREIHCPVLLVKPRPKEPFRLKVGDALA